METLDKHELNALMKENKSVFMKFIRFYIIQETQSP